MIEPTVGRVVLYFAPTVQSSPMAAIICHVHDSRTVNLAGFDADGTPFRAIRVRLFQPDEPAYKAAHAEWMPFQKAQATAADTPGGLMDRVAKLEERMRLSRY